MKPKWRDKKIWTEGLTAFSHECTSEKCAAKNNSCWHFCVCIFINMWLCKYTGRHYITFWYIWVFFAAPVAVLEISIIMGTLCLGTFNRVWEGSCGTRSGSCFCLLMNIPPQYVHARVHITPYAHTGCWTNWIKHDIALTKPMHKEQATHTNLVCLRVCVRACTRECGTTH